MPLFFFVMNVTKWVADDETGQIPGWMAAGMAVLMHGVWGSYDWVFKPVFGEGERTVHSDDGGDGDDGDKDGEEEEEKGWVNGKKRSGSWLSGRRRRRERVIDDEEKRCLLDTAWEEDECQ